MSMQNQTGDPNQFGDLLKTQIKPDTPGPYDSLVPGRPTTYHGLTAGSMGGVATQLAKAADEADGPKGAALGAASGAAGVATLFMMFSAPISVPIVVAGAVVMGVAGWFKKKP